MEMTFHDVPRNDTTKRNCFLLAAFIYYIRAPLSFSVFFFDLLTSLGSFIDSYLFLSPSLPPSVSLARCCAVRGNGETRF